MAPVRPLALALAPLLAVAGATASPAAAEPATAAVAVAAPTELVVEFAAGTTGAERAAAVEEAGLVVVGELAGGDFAVVAAPDGSPVAPDALDGEVVADLDRPVRLTALGAPDDPLYPSQWHLHEIGAAEAWDAATGAGVVVAVVDTGVARDAPDLAGTAFAPGRDFVDGDANPHDLHGHGTHVAGVLAQTTGNGYGGAGVAPGATIMPLRALDAAGSGTDVAVADAIYHAVAHGADVVNLSLGGPSGSSLLQRAVRDAAAAGVLVVAAAGNDGGPVRFPAAYPEVVAVGATRPDRTLAPFSSRGPELDLVAPGTGILQQGFTSPGAWCWCRANGTSLAAPQVAGAAALLLGAGVGSAAEARALLERTAVDLGPAGRDATFGAGLVQAAGALAAARPPAPAPAAPDDPVAPVAAQPGTPAVQGLDHACPASLPRGRFADVDPVSVHARAVDCVAWLGFTSGGAGGSFDGGAPVSRAQMATFLARLLARAGVALPDAPPDAFDDDAGSPHETAVDQLAAVGVVRGTGHRTFSPGAPVSRAAMATFLAAVHDRAATTALPPAPDAFGDDDGNVHEPAIDRLAAAGIATGTGAGRFSPGTAVGRAQMATFLARTFDVLVGAGDAPRP